VDSNDLTARAFFLDDPFFAFDGFVQNVGAYPSLFVVDFYEFAYFFLLEFDVYDPCINIITFIMSNLLAGTLRRQQDG